MDEQVIWKVPEHVRPEFVVPIDPLGGPEVLAFPPAAYDKLRDPYRIFYSPFYGGFWVLTRYEDIVNVFLDPDNYGQWVDGIPPAPYPHRQIPVGLNPPEHRPWRRLLTPFFSPARAKLMEPMLSLVARECVESFIGRGECEIFAEYALALPSTVFCLQLGVAIDDFSTFRAVAFDIVYGTSKAAVERGADAAVEHRRVAVERLDEMLNELVKVRRRSRHQGDDLISGLMVAELDGSLLTDSEVVEACNFLFRAGTDSTAAMIAYSFLYFSNHPVERAQFIGNFQMQDAAISELIRYNSFVTVPRIVRNDVRIGTADLRKGDLVLLATNAASRDPQMYEGPECMKFDRSHNQQIAFGWGIHRCLGMHQAREEIAVALNEFHRLIPDYQLDERIPINYIAATNKARPNVVPVTFPAG
jgi:cytochrome P450